MTFAFREKYLATVARVRGSNFYVVRPNPVSVTIMMDSGVRKHAEARGIWGHDPPGIFLKFIVSETASGSF